MSVLVKVARQDIYKYRWYDPVVKRPRPRDIDELESLSKSTTIGGLGGALAGATIGAGSVLLTAPRPRGVAPGASKRQVDLYNELLSQIRLDTAGKAIRGAVVGGATGFGLGSVGGQILGNRRVLKNRHINKAPVYTEEEVEDLIRGYGVKGGMIPSSRLSISVDPSGL